MSQEPLCTAECGKDETKSALSRRWVDNVHALLFYLLDVQQPSLELIHLGARQNEGREQGNLE
jgi:hypothetical protein